MGFPHLPRPPAPSLELWVQTFSCQKRPCGLTKKFMKIARKILSFVKLDSRRRRLFHENSNHPSLNCFWSINI